MMTGRMEQVALSSRRSPPRFLCTRRPSPLIVNVRLASSRRQFAADEKLKAEDAALSAAYFGLLKSIKDKGVHDMLIFAETLVEGARRTVRQGRRQPFRDR